MCIDDRQILGNLRIDTEMLRCPIAIAIFLAKNIDN